MEKENQDNKTTHNLKLAIVGILCFAVLMMMFGVGVFVGQERAEFSYRWAENYHRNFGGPQRGIFGNFPVQSFVNGHGVFGPVISIDQNNLIIKSQDSKEETVIVSDKTAMINNAGTITLHDIEVGDSAVIIGAPNSQGQIDAKFIRILPPGTSFLPSKNMSSMFPGRIQMRGM